MMKKGIKGLVLVFAAFSILACSQTEFGETPSTDHAMTVLVGQVDILFVVDNSGSMSEEQRKMGASFRNLVQGLDLAGMDYRIGMITTDVESAKNSLKDFGQGKGVIQNGNLIKFDDGSYYLTPYSSNIEWQFEKAVQRRETDRCERSGFTDCPSDDERGIYAASLTVRANKRNFFREGGHAAFIFLTDENERGAALNNHPHFWPEGGRDYPVDLVKAVNERFGLGKTMSVHAIITNNETCKAQQKAQHGNQNIFGEIGTFYARLTRPSSKALIGVEGKTLNDYAQGRLVPGVIGSICSDNYTAAVGSIKNVLTQEKREEKLKCILFDEDSLNVRISSEYSWELSESKDSVIFTPALPVGKSFKMSYRCH